MTLIFTLVLIASVLNFNCADVTTNEPATLSSNINEIVNVTNHLEENASVDNRKSDYSSTTELSQKCHYPAITNLTAIRKLNNLEVTWDSMHETLDVDDDCEMTYTINVTYKNNIIPYFRKISVNKHTFYYIQPCEYYNISVKAANKYEESKVISQIFKAEPEDINQLTVHISNGRTYVEWEEAKNVHCSKYKLLIDDKGIEVDSTNYVANETLYCSKIGVQTIRTDGLTGKITYALVPGKITEMKLINVGSDKITVAWKPPEIVTCVIGYNITIKSDKEIIQTIEQKAQLETSVTFPDLDACTEYSISVTAISELLMLGEQVDIRATTTKPIYLNAVDNFEMQFDKDAMSIHASWKPPLKQRHCVSDYILTYDISKVIEEETVIVNNVSYLFENVIGCGTYNVQLASRTDDLKAGSSVRKTITTPAIVSNPPTNKALEVFKTSATSTWTLDSILTNNCKYTKIIVTCNAALEDNENWQWIKRTGKSEVALIDREPIKVETDQLSEFTNYTCTAILENIAGTSNVSEVITFQTKPNVPSTPQDLMFKNVQPNSFELSWKEPNKIPGILKSYKVIIERVGSVHFIADGCLTAEEETTEFILPAEANGFKFDKAMPSFKYTARVSAETIDFGPESFVHIETNNSVSEKPRNVEYAFRSDTQEDLYNVTLILSWLYPCNTNGKIKEFNIDVFGEAENTSVWSQDLRLLSVGVNEPVNNIDYVYEIPNIMALHNYTITIQLISIDYIFGDKEFINFTSPIGLPSKPILQPVTVITTYSFIINWNEPENKNGAIKSYSVTIKSLKPLHEVPIDCYIDTNVIEHNLEANKRSYVFENALPNYLYEILVNASTEAGFGSAANTTVATLETNSEIVRELSYDIIKLNESVDEYNFEVNVHFEPPCNLNGVLEKYEVSLFGERAGYDDEKESITDIVWKYTFILKPEYEYIVSVTVHTKTVSEIKELNFTSPSGIPKPPTNRAIIRDDGNNNPIVVIQKDFFSAESGNILYYAIILSDETFVDDDNEPNCKCGQWNGIVWPETGKWRLDNVNISRYQATPIMWNPFLLKTDPNDTSAVFVIGTDNCTSYDYCNGPLRANTRYALVVRGFTKDGYRDSDVVIFESPSVEDLDTTITTAEILGIVIGILAFFISAGVMIFFWRKRSTKKIDDVLEEVEIFPVAVPVKKFSKYYTDMQENMHKVKNEFSMLNVKSAENIPTCDMGQLPENKKKNRYTNILPYDENRVISQNNLESDYVNASFIKGYTNKHEYIATQGPLESTTLDFWRMVMDENVTVIVMVAQFVEQTKEKCHKYFPDNHEQVTIGDDILIRCATELDFSTYKERHIVIQKDNEQCKVIHLQFMDWPDFGCPAGTENMLNFCNVMRKCIENSYGKTIVHCSAGVGRTGTLIAIDVLLQTIEDGGDVDVYSTVLNLRKQRKSMVQTEGQYMYIYTCIYDSIKNPKELKEIKATEPIYENLQEKIPMNEFKSDSNENVRKNVIEDEENEANSSL